MGICFREFICELSIQDTSGHYGIAVPGYHLDVIYAKHGSPERNTIGELRIKGPTISSGYWNSPGKTSETFKEGWLISDDRYFENVHGEYVFVGRHGDTFKSSGLWVSTLEIEWVIGELEFIAESSVVVFQGNDGLPRAKAYLVAKDAPTFAKREDVEMKTRSYLKIRLPRYKVPHSVEVVDELPRTTTGKIAKTVLQEMAQEVIWTSRKSMKVEVSKHRIGKV